ncbi:MULTISPECIES: tRNA pseudouridine(38-40) synthase TruA [Zobellia]|uniref:tRNA pseudouridine(38-40) synthase TruA n=1 Tax=Zobellia TaxID=112040 RepID=UPI001BFF4742|nr:MULTISPECIES: tRNA pseudouridine(38-40) synthase TruA [Zobellia]MBT9189950.1 tRNA pseudouridine(38-40) synthase TruA [Zobellia russellii]MDO6821212.1 tRNA pseudouridine(38-40) synthase TruA [Zobellia sp. 1_MG-2023]
MRYFVEFSYLGKDYHGWQNQPNAISVQEVLEKAFSTLLRTPLALTGAGRTDAGVHAKQMFAHFEVDEIQNLEQLVYRLNSLLPEAIAVHDIFAVHEDAHARFDAQERTYEYWVLQNKNPFYIDFAHYVKHPLDIGAMNDAAQFLLQFSDFECFSKTHTDVKTYLCDVKKAVWEIKDDKLVFTITADRFLRNMVRAVVGTLLDVGTGKIKPAHVKSIINSKNRGNAGPSVPAKGLYLTSVLYPKKITEKHG